MAHIRPHQRQWLAQVERRGVRRSKVFEFRSEAKAWAAALEAEILASTCRGLASSSDVRAESATGGKGGAA